jgi:membrane associated rhomboid family serine protease
MTKWIREELNSGNLRQGNFYLKKNNSLFTRIAGLPVTLILIIISVVISIIGFILTAIDEQNISYFALKGTNIMHGQYLWTLVTHMFVHGGFLHLFINMFVLYSLGIFCERIIGRKRFFWFYLISGIFAGILSVLLAYYFGNSYWGGRIFGDPDIYMVGASGAIFAIAGLYVILLPKAKFMIIFLPFFTLPAYIMIPLALFVMWGGSAIFNWPIGNAAHFGGFLAGLVYGFYLRTKYKKKVQMLQRMVR